MAKPGAIRRWGKRLFLKVAGFGLVATQASKILSYRHQNKERKIMGWEIPSGLNELFDNVPAQYSIIDSDYSGDNVYAMNLFIESVEGLDNCIITDDGTQIVAERNGKKIVIDSGGLGDFDRHGYDVTEYKEE